MNNIIKSGFPRPLCRLVMAILIVGMSQFEIGAVSSRFKQIGNLATSSEKIMPHIFSTGSNVSDVSAPVFQPSSCTFTTPISIEILADEGCNVYYRTDGDNPTVDEQYKYNGPIVISSTTIFKAIAADSNGNASRIVTSEYTCNRHGIGEGYDPASPGNPGSITGETQEKTYKLTVVTNPSGAGSAYANSYTIKAGDKTYVYTYNNNGFDFLNWTIEGNEVSKSTSFYYVMPEYDVTIVANYSYNPASPGNPSPEEQKVRHPVVVRAIPSGAASLSPSGAFNMEENASCQIYAYPQTSWKLSGWTVNGIQQSQTTSPLSITMEEKALDIAAYFTYDPSSPSNPGANYFNPATGQVIIDDFTPGNLYNSLDALVGYSNFSNISSLIVKGRMTSNDLGNLNYFSKAETIDLSRTGGVSSIPGYTFQSMGVLNVILPSTIGNIGNYAFRYCENLASLTVYAQEPPTCNSYTFSGFTNKDNCVVYVPASAIELYSNADYWKDFSIMPITTDAHVLQVNLPEDASDGRYKNNSLEIVNINSGVRQKYVISDRLLYTFNGLQKDEQYNIYIYSQAGLEIGRIENVVIPDQDIEVTFDNLKSLYTVFAKVLASDDSDVTSQVTVEWLKPLADGTTTYLRKAVSLGEIPDGQKLICRVSLDNKLGVVYANPKDVEFAVGADNNICTVNLTPFRAIELTGSVVDGDGAYLSGASVSVNQTLNGKYSKTYTAKTDRKGQWNVTVLDAPETRLNYAATECVNVNDTIGAFAADVTVLDLGKTTMKSIVGARVTYGFTYHAAGSEDVQDYYSDYQNVTISVFNVTQNRAHKDVSLQYPILAVLDENINTGDELRLTATSKKGVFNPIEQTVTVGDGQRAEVTFDIIGKGGISASFEMTENPAVIAMLYSSNGELLKKVTYSEAKATFIDLEDGDYTLVSMGQSDLMNSILRLSNFSEIGLTEGKDYVKTAVKVETGKLTEVKISEVPAFDESLFYYTNSNTSFSSNKSSITTGNYLTLRSTIDFKGAYKNDISNVALIVDLPEACDFVEQSVIQGPNLLPYTLDNKRLTVQLGNNYQSQTRFCVIPTSGGSFNATASIVFDYNGKTITQPIGSVSAAIKDIGINVDNLISTPTFTVTGLAPKNSSITIFANREIIGKTNSKLNSHWKANCSLINSFNLSNYTITAEIETPNNLKLVTESKSIQYVKDYPIIKTVTMNTNPEIVFDFEDGTTSNSWFYAPGSVTFTLNFSDNSPEIIREVYLNIYGEDGSIKTIECSYDRTKSVWFANNKFDFYNGVVNLSVNYIANGDYSYESAEAELFSHEQGEIITKENEVYENLSKDLSDMFEYIDEDHTYEEIVTYIKRVRRKVCDYYYDENDNEYKPLDVSELTDDNYSGGKIVLYGERPEDQDPELEPYYKDLESPYNETFKTPDSNASSSISSSRDQSMSYVASGDFDFDSWADAFSGNGNFSLQNSKGDTWNGQISLSQSIDFDSENSVRNFFDVAGRTIQDIVRQGTFANDALTAASLTADLASSVQMRHFNNNFDELVAIAGNKNPAVRQEAKALEKAIANNLKDVKAAKVAGNLLSGVSSFMGGWGVGADITTGYSRFDEWTYIINSIEASCQGKDVSGLIERARRYRGWVARRDGGKTILDGGNTALGIAGAAAAPETAGASLLLNLVSLGIDRGLNHWGNSYIKTNTEHIAEITREARKSTSCPKDPFYGGYPGNPYYSGAYPNSPYYGDYTPNAPVFEPLQINHDPAGYVYEAVPVNRVEGVQASIYYKEIKEDMYGDPYEEIVLWDAEEYAQKNPLFTDENGMYQWDVPQGLWQVKFEKDGYQTAYSEWLPVPPPQLEVNIGIIQNKQPEVTEARAYEDGVEVQFDKFMDLSTLTTDNFFVTANGEKLNGEIRLIDSALADEYASEDDADAVHYASRIRFIPKEKLSANTGEIRVTVSRNVLSYAGIPMTETFSQVLDVEKEVHMIVADDVKVLYGGEKEVTVYAMPFEASVGRKLNITNSSDLIASIDTTEVTLDEEGKAVVTVKGELPGRAQLKFTIDDVTATGECAVDVVTEIITAEAPKSSRASGSAVYRGTKVALTTESKDATIYFTTDGSCPCDENGTRRKYTVPIIINDDTKILAMTSVGTGDDDVSETVEFNYTLKRSDMDFQMEEGWTWVSHNFESAITPTDFSSNESVTRILSQTKEVIRDPQLGMIGTLTELSAPESYKVESSTATDRQRLSNIAWNPAIPITLSPGWNWLGYPVCQTMSVDEAFATTNAETLDVVVGQNGFAQFDGENWVGTLETMSPGMGYMYQSQSAKDVVYNTSIVSSASAKYAAGISKSLPLVLDIHKYGTIMPVVATINNIDGLSLDNEDYQVAAFCGSECRGIGRVVNGIVMMNVYGNVNDVITFHVTDVDGENTFGNNASLKFSEKVVGDIFDPYAITINNQSGIANVKYDGNIKVFVDGNMLRIKGIAADKINLVEVYDINGQKLIHETHISESGIRISNLTNGAYVVIVNGNGEYTYHKIAVR